MNYEALLKQAKRWRKFDDDVVSEGIAVFLQNPPDNEGAAAAYLHKICERIKLKANKQTSEIYVLPDDSQPIGFHDDVHIPELIERLGELERTVVVMSFYECFKRRDISLRLGVTDIDVKNALQRSIYRLRQAILSEYAI